MFLVCYLFFKDFPAIFNSTWGYMHFQGRKREAVLTEQQRRIKEAIIQAKVAAVPDDLELKAVKAMGAMEEGDAVFGAGAEVNLDSQVSHVLLAIP